MIWPFPKVIDSSRCKCNCHNTATEYHATGVPIVDPVHALTACSVCRFRHRIAFIQRKPKRPESPYSDETGG